MNDICANKHGGNASSREAFQQHRLNFGNQREQIYALLCGSKEGMTSKQIAEHFGWALNCMSGRLSELRKAGKIRGTKTRREGAEVLVAA